MRDCSIKIHILDEIINLNFAMQLPKLQQKLTQLRSLRGFEAHNILQWKVERINIFFKAAGLDAAIVGLSGGVDSALVAALLVAAAQQLDSPLRKVFGIIAPICGKGTSGQDIARDKALTMCELLQHRSDVFDYQVCDLSESYEALLKASQPPNFEPNAWAEGQMASVLRTPLFYYQAALVQQQGFRSLVVGTTNRDEGAYIGFFGKASDAMVDLQPIADLHKSEVWELSKLLGIIPEIMEAAPRGDVWDNRTDEEMIGAPYWFLELYQLLLQYKQTSDFEASLSGGEWQFYQRCKNNIEALHHSNAHKYQVGSPAHYLDVLPRGLPIPTSHTPHDT